MLHRSLLQQLLHRHGGQHGAAAGGGRQTSVELGRAPEAVFNPGRCRYQHLPDSRRLQLLGHLVGRLLLREQFLFPGVSSTVSERTLLLVRLPLVTPEWQSLREGMGWMAVGKSSAEWRGGKGCEWGLVSGVSGDAIRSREYF